MSIIGDFGVFWTLAGFNAVFFLIGYFLVPETKGCSLEEIEQRVKANVPLRQIGQPLSSASSSTQQTVPLGMQKG